MPPDSFECKLGVRQGECLSPFLFARYINDLEEKLDADDAGVTVDDVKILLLFYADDCVIFSETPAGLQTEIDKLYQYCEKWKLKLNTEKSQVVVFRKGNRGITETWHFGNKNLSTTNKFPYLGVLFTSNGSFHQAQVTLASQANKAVFMLYKKLSCFVNLKPDFMMDMFDKFIAPILNYGCEVWGFHQAPNIEQVHLKFCKNVLGVKKCTQNDFVYGELDRLPMQIIRYIRILKYWLKIVHGKKSHYINVLYCREVRDIDTNDKMSWARSVKNLLCGIGFGEVWYNQGVGNIDLFVKILKQRLTDINFQDWQSRLDNSSRARFYRVIKPQKIYSNYLSVVVSKAHRIALTRFLLSSHSLHVETGRWNRPPTPPERRFCHICTSKIEDEFHMVFECQLYNELRARLIPRYYRQRPSMYKLVELSRARNSYGF